MKKIATSLFIAALLTSGASADTNTNKLQITSAPDSEFNYQIVGQNNALFIEQTKQGGLAANNRIEVLIDGDLNGGPTGAVFSSNASVLDLTPGTIRQDGFDNAISLSVTGSQNLFAFLQEGTANVIDARVLGTGNEASVMQLGQANHLSFSQSGTSNSLTVRQRSW